MDKDDNLTVDYANIELPRIDSRWKGAQPLTKGLLSEASTLLDCGGVCDNTGTDRVPYSGSPMVRIKKPIQCQRVMFRLLAQHPALEWPPPKAPPQDMLEDYTMGGHAVLVEWYLQRRYSGSNAQQSIWTVEAVEALRRQPVGISIYGPKIDQYIIGALQKYRADIRGKMGLVIGTEKPWVEAHLLNAGAEHVVTLEYGRIRSEHPRLTPVLPQELAALYLEKGGVQVDFMVTYSSIEHSGLGRYGDALNPFGDFEAMAQAWCLLKPGGLAMVGVPTYTRLGRGVDVLFWNAHRVYSAVRGSHLGANFDFVEFLQSEGTKVAEASEFFVFRKPLDPENKLYVE